MPAAHPMARSAVARLLVTACVARGFSSVPRRLARAPNTRFDTACGVFKEPTNPVPFKEPVRPKKKLRPKDPSLYMEPVPLVPDANGNWEPLVSEIWADIEKMNKLETLKLDMNRALNAAPELGGADGTIKSLTLWETSNCNLTALPDSLLHAHFLVTLNCSSNKLAELPALELPCLEILNVSSNALKELPVEIGLCSKLKTFFFSGNQIKDCLLYTSPSPRDATLSRMPSSA